MTGEGDLPGPEGDVTQGAPGHEVLDPLEGVSVMLGILEMLILDAATTGGDCVIT